MPKDSDNPFDFLSNLLKSQDIRFSEIPKGKEFLGQLANWAGKGKDEIVNMICKEIGLAVAATLKEPLRQAFQDKSLRFTVDLVPKDDEKQSKKK